MTDLSQSLPRPHLVAVLGGVVVIAMQFIFAAVTPDMLCGEVRPLPIFDYQFAASQADLDLLFGPAGSACQAELAGVLGRVNLVDVLLFIPAFTALMLGFFWGERRRMTGLAVAGAALALVAGAADIVETVNELDQTANAPSGIVFMPTAFAATLIKFWGLALAGVVAGLHLVMRAGLLPRILGTIALLGGLAAVAALAGVTQREAVTLGIAAAWIAMFAYSLLVVVSSRRASSRPWPASR